MFCFSRFVLWVHLYIDVHCCLSILYMSQTTTQTAPHSLQKFLPLSALENLLSHLLRTLLPPVLKHLPLQFGYLFTFQSVFSVDSAT